MTLGYLVFHTNFHISLETNVWGLRVAVVLHVEDVSGRLQRTWPAEGLRIKDRRIQFLFASPFIAKLSEKVRVCSSAVAYFDSLKPASERPKIIYGGKR